MIPPKSCLISGLLFVLAACGSIEEISNIEQAERWSATSRGNVTTPDATFTEITTTPMLMSTGECRLKFVVRFNANNNQRTYFRVKAEFKGKYYWGFSTSNVFYSDVAGCHTYTWYGTFDSKVCLSQEWVTNLAVESWTPILTFEDVSELNPPLPIDDAEAATYLEYCDGDETLSYSIDSESLKTSVPLEKKE